MVWSFLWRFLLFAAPCAWGVTWALGFLMGLAGSSAEAVRNAGVPAQIVGLLAAAASAYLLAKDAQGVKA